MTQKLTYVKIQLASAITIIVFHRAQYHEYDSGVLTVFRFAARVHNPLHSLKKDATATEYCLISIIRQT